MKASLQAQSKAHAASSIAHMRDSHAQHAVVAFPGRSHARLDGHFFVGNIASGGFPH
jgi:hypothetical protein